MQLTAENVRSVFIQCLYADADDVAQFPATIVRGVMLHVGFDPRKLQAREQDIANMLTQLPVKFMQNGGGGWSFLNAVVDQKEQQWADVHEVVDMLLCLGLAIGKIEYNAPRDAWAALPGSMPFFYIKN